ncbi:large neutral amino acids transporter small subunit 2-like [Uloborus diversus]|uniref:large neutral amino acids transporter small subunit 2-like n=1 Tax=Uloborus diversus TaxID=327109 RepID=UPI00240949F6|nr:large neutral amino acids transporter small subunit 2-like [Uloborus diversus]
MDISEENRASNSPSITCPSCRISIVPSRARTMCPFCGSFYNRAANNDVSLRRRSSDEPVRLPQLVDNVNALLSILYLCSSDIYALINYVGFATWLAIGLAVLCLPYLRWKQPNLPRPIRVNLIFPIIYIIASIFITVVPMMADPVGTGFGALIIATGIPVYLIFVYWENKPKAIRGFFDSMTFTLQKLLVVVPSEKSA